MRLSVLPLLAIVAVGLLLTACGYRPLYGNQGKVTAAGMETVKIGLIENRTGQILRNLLLDQVNPNGEPIDPEYSLSVSLRESRQDLGLRKDETATRANLIITASYQLTKNGHEKPIMSATSRSTNSFNILDDQFATVVTEKDARRRGVRELSEQIALRLAIYFNSLASGS